MPNAIDIKTKVFLPRTYVILADFGHPVQALWPTFAINKKMHALK
jgi:hypothetical protein